MKRIAFFWVLAFGFCLAQDVDAQRPVQRRNNYGTQPQQQQPAQRNNYGNPDAPITDTTAPNNYDNTGNTGMAIDPTLPITVIQGSNNGLLDSTKMSLRPDGAFERNLIRERIPLTYEDIREDDAVFVVRVWREIDAREKINLPFRYAAVEDNGSQRFISILLKAIKDGPDNGGVVAFSGDDDRFTTPITADEAMNAFGGGSDTVKVYDDEGNVKGYQVRPKATDPDSIYKFRLKEEWVFDKESSRLFIRIIGIAPVIPYKLSTGDVIANSDRPVWWVYYPDLRGTLAKYDVYNPKNLSAGMTWEELFESRMFSSYVVKSTIDNPFDLQLSSVFPDNTLFRLLQGEKIKEKIFNYEQSLWSY